MHVALLSFLEGIFREQNSHKILQLLRQLKCQDEEETLARIVQLVELLSAILSTLRLQSAMSIPTLGIFLEWQAEIGGLVVRLEREERIFTNLQPSKAQESILKSLVFCFRFIGESERPGNVLNRMHCLNPSMPLGWELSALLQQAQQARSAREFCLALEIFIHIPHPTRRSRKLEREIEQEQFFPSFDLRQSMYRCLLVDTLDYLFSYFLDSHLRTVLRFINAYRSCLILEERSLGLYHIFHRLNVHFKASTTFPIDRTSLKAIAFLCQCKVEKEKQAGHELLLILTRYLEEKQKQEQQKAGHPQHEDNFVSLIIEAILGICTRFVNIHDEEILLQCLQSGLPIAFRADLHAYMSLFSWLVRRSRPLFVKDSPWDQLEQMLLQRASLPSDNDDPTTAIIHTDPIFDAYLADQAINCSMRSDNVLGRLLYWIDQKVLIDLQSGHFSKTRRALWNMPLEAVIKRDLLDSMMASRWLIGCLNHLLLDHSLLHTINPLLLILLAQRLDRTGLGQLEDILQHFLHSLHELEGCRGGLFLLFRQIAPLKESLTITQYAHQIAKSVIMEGARTSCEIALAFETLQIGSNDKGLDLLEFLSLIQGKSLDREHRYKCKMIEHQREIMYTSSTLHRHLSSSIPPTSLHKVLSTLSSVTLCGLFLASGMRQAIEAITVLHQHDLLTSKLDEQILGALILNDFIFTEQTLDTTRTLLYSLEGRPLIRSLLIQIIMECQSVELESEIVKSYFDLATPKLVKWEVAFAIQILAGNRQHPHGDLITENGPLLGELFSGRSQRLLEELYIESPVCAYARRLALQGPQPFTLLRSIPSPYTRGSTFAERILLQMYLICTDIAISPLQTLPISLYTWTELVEATEVFKNRQLVMASGFHPYPLQHIAMAIAARLTLFCQRGDPESLRNGQAAFCFFFLLALQAKKPAIPLSPLKDESTGS